MSLADKAKVLKQDFDDVYRAGVAVIANAVTNNGTDFSDMFSHSEGMQDSIVKFLKLVDTSNGKNFSEMFRYCRDVGEVPYFDTSNGTNFSYMFNYTGSNLSVAPKFPTLNTSNGTNFSYMFAYTRLAIAPAIDTSKGTNFSDMFASCQSLTEVPELDTSQGTSFTSMFYLCQRLVTIGKLNFTKATGNLTSVLNQCSSLKNITLEGTVKQNITFSSSAPLTHESLMSILNALYDFSDTTTTKTLTIGSKNIAKLTDSELEIATNKGWTIV